MLPLDIAGGAMAGGDEDVTIHMKGVAGAELTVYANSVTCPDGSNECLVSFTQVNASRMSMEPPLASYPMLAWTVQPAGVRFDPPARVCIPNNGMTPGSQVEMYYFDTSFNDWSTFGLATVTEDGSQLCSDPGFGVTRGAWTCCIPPPKPPTCKARLPRVVVFASANGETRELITDKEKDIRFTAGAFSNTCGGFVYKWNFGDGNTASGSSVVHQYAKNGTYIVSVNVNCEGDCDKKDSERDRLIVNANGLRKTINGRLPTEKEDVDFFAGEDLVVAADVVGINDETIIVEVLLDGQIVGSQVINGGESFTYKPTDPGRYTITATPNGVALDPESWEIVVNEDVLVIGWIDPTILSSKLQSIRSQTNPILISTLEDRAACFFLTTTSWPGGVRSFIESDIDRQFANNFLLANSPNPQPSNTLNESQLQDYRDTLEPRLLNRPILQSEEGFEIGPTPEPCSGFQMVIPFVGLQNGEIHEENGTDGNLSNGGKFFLNQGRIGITGQQANRTINFCTSSMTQQECLNVTVPDKTPWIYSVIRFNGNGAYDNSNFGNDIQAYPTYYFYRFNNNNERYELFNSRPQPTSEDSFILDVVTVPEHVDFEREIEEIN